MKINSLYISAFGGIKNLQLDFTDGFNVIYGNNEDGKSTLMAFIKMMFYGSERASSAIAKNIRKKYTPWDSAQMAGSIDFEHGGKKYRIEKEFRSSNSTDKTTLVDLTFGTRQAVASDIGTKFFGLSLAAFERSVFIGQFGFPDSDPAAESELNSKLSNISLTGDEDISYEKVFSRLKKARLTLMSKGGKAGEYDKNTALLTDAKLRLSRANELHHTLSLAKKEAEELKKEIELLIKECEALKKRISFEEDARKSEKLKEFLEVKEQLDSLNQNLRLNDGALIDEMFLRKLQFCISKLDAAENKVNEKQNQINLLRTSLESGADSLTEATPEMKEALEKEICDLEAEAEENKGKLARLKEQSAQLTVEYNKYSALKPKGSLFLISGLIFIAVAAALGISNLIIPAAVSGAVGLIIAAVGIAFLSGSSKSVKTAESIANLKKQAEELAGRDLSKEIFNKRVRLEAVITAINSNSSLIEKQKELLQNSTAELEELLADAENEKATLSALYSKYKPFISVEEIENTLEEITEISTKQKELKSQLGFIAKDLGNISYSEAELKLEELKKRSVEVADFDALKNELELKSNILTDKKTALATLLSDAKNLSQGIENPENIKREIVSLETKTASQKEFCDACEIAMQALYDSYGELRSSFGSALEATATENFAALTGGKYSNMTISDSFELGVTEAEAFGNRQIDYLSSGTADQAYLSLRLALSSLMNEEEKLPILLDDALAQYDDTRCETALEFLKEYSGNAQLIMFTCHKHIAETAQNLGAECKKLK